MTTIRLCGGPFAGRIVKIGNGADSCVVKERTGAGGYWWTVAQYGPSRPLKYGAGGVPLWRILASSMTPYREDMANAH
jgi:hypothetical protein